MISNKTEKENEELRVSALWSSYCLETGWASVCWWEMASDSLCIICSPITSCIKLNISNHELTFFSPFLSPTLRSGTGIEQLCECLAPDRSQSLPAIFLSMCNCFSNYKSYFNTCLLRMSSIETSGQTWTDFFIIHVIKTIFCPLVMLFFFYLKQSFRFKG